MSAPSAEDWAQAVQDMEQTCRRNKRDSFLIREIKKAAERNRVTRGLSDKPATPPESKP